MRDSELSVVGSLVALLLLTWLGFLVHRDPLFAGSFTGTMVGIAAAVCMLGEFFYFLVKRLATVKSWITRFVSMRELLAWHVYGGILGPVLALVHSAHRYDSLLGKVLIPLILINVLCGYAGRYLYKQSSTELRDKQKLQAGLKTEYAVLAKAFAAETNGTPDFVRTGDRLGLTMSLGFGAGGSSRSRQLLRVVDALSDIEYSIRAHDILKAWFRRCMQLHLALSVLILSLLAFHVWAELNVGLRWL